MPIIADVAPATGPTLDQLVTDIIATAQGLAIAPDQFVTLVGDLTPGALAFKIEGEASPGVMEIGDELIYVTQVDTQTGDCAIHPRGRGWQGSTPAAHTAGDVVTVAPALPRSRCAMLINDVVSRIYPKVFGVGTTTTTTSTTAVALEIPAEAEFVLDVRYLCDDDWERVRRWEAEMSSASGTTGKVVRVPGVPVGTTVQVVYGIRPEPLGAPTQRWSETGLSIAVKDLVVTGVLAKFAKTLDLGRLTDRFTTPKGDQQQPQLGAGFAMARQLEADFTAALDAEALALRNQYRARAHFVR